MYPYSYWISPARQFSARRTRDETDPLWVLCLLGKHGRKQAASPVSLKEADRPKTVVKTLDVVSQLDTPPPKGWGILGLPPQRARIPSELTACVPRFDVLYSEPRLRPGHGSYHKTDKSTAELAG